MVEIRDEFEVSTRSSIFPESNRVGSLSLFVNPNSSIISMSLLCLAAVCELVEHILTQLISGRLKYPARMTDGGGGGVFCSCDRGSRGIRVMLRVMLCSSLEVCSRMLYRLLFCAESVVWSI